MISFRFFFAILIVSASMMTSAAEGKSLSMKPLPDDPVVEPQIIGGRLAKRANWQSTFILYVDGVGLCTSTAIGKRVILTAAHCIEGAGNPPSIQIEIGGQPMDVDCTRSPNYTTSRTDLNPNLTTSADWALCAASGDIDVPEYETINTDSAQLKRGQELLLTGYGCNKDGGSDNGFGQLFEGEAYVDEIPRAGAPVHSKINYITTSGGAAVCSGDSGGATYKFLDGAKKSRVLVGINSRGDLSKISLISSTSTETFQSWASQWASKAGGLAICGLPGGASRCHP